MELTKLFNLFNGKTEGKQLDELETLLIQNGFIKNEVNKRGTYTAWFTKDGVDTVFALAVKKNKSQWLPVIMPASFARKFYMKNGEFYKGITLSTHSFKNSDLVAVINYNGKLNERLHRAILIEAGVDIEGMEVDHITCHEGVNVVEELRPCTSSENKANKFTTENSVHSSFKYDVTHDFRNSVWIPALHYVLGIISKEDMYTLRRMEVA